MGRRPSRPLTASLAGSHRGRRSRLGSAPGRSSGAPTDLQCQRVRQPGRLDRIRVERGSTGATCLLGGMPSSSVVLVKNLRANPAVTSFVLDRTAATVIWRSGEMRISPMIRVTCLPAKWARNTGPTCGHTTEKIRTGSWSRSTRFASTQLTWPPARIEDDRGRGYSGTLQFGARPEGTGPRSPTAFRKKVALATTSSADSEVRP